MYTEIISSLPYAKIIKVVGNSTFNVIKIFSYDSLTYTMINIK